MQEQQIIFQKNHHPRDYVYELSSVYLLARSLHLAYALKLHDTIIQNTITLDNIDKFYPSYDKQGLVTLLKFLCSYNIFKLDNNKISVTALSDLSIVSNLSNDWEKSYDILEYLTSNPAAIVYFKSPNVNITVKDNSLRFIYNNPKHMLLELSSLHLLSRAIHFTTTSNLFNILANHNHKITIQDLVQALCSQENSQFTVEKADALRKILQLFNRYQILNYDEIQEEITATPFSYYLQKDFPETMYPAMFVVNEKWWKAAGQLEKSFESNSLSAFQSANSQTFYQALDSNPNQFLEGMNALSLLEDNDVAESNSKLVSEFANLIDIAGGQGGLLGAYYNKMKTQTKKYLLFEKDSGDQAINEKFIKSIQDYVVSKFGSAFKMEILLGDFTKPETLPKSNNAAYLIKCVLHNMNEKEAVEMLKNVREAMGESCQLFLAERVVPNLVSTPHLNKMGNILMRMLFKANAHDAGFYESILNKAGFDLKDVHEANNYLVFSAMEKETPALRFSKATQASTPFWQQNNSKEKPQATMEPEKEVSQQVFN